MSFNINLDAKKFGTFNVFGAGGITKAGFQTPQEGQESAVNQEINDSTTGIVGVKHMKFLNKLI
ncbi:MAG: hypothetical protein AAFZ63_17100 [Bacteroidota bacterium]